MISKISFIRSRNIDNNFSSLRHSIRATEFALKIAKEMGINSEELIKVKNGSLFHDIGKLNVPIDILFKKDWLIEHEFEVLKKHPEFACDMLDRYDFLKDIYCFY